MNYTQHAFFLLSGGRALSATCLLPHQTFGTLLMIPPLAEERKGALPVFTNLARQLAAQGIASLLFDFSGCGDSQGDFEELPPDRFDLDCENASNWLADAFPSVPHAVLGLRTGALLANRLADRHPDITARVLWSPVSGADFLRQLFQRRMVNDMVAYGKARESRAALEARLKNGESVDLDGYLLSAPLHAWLQALEPAAAGSKGPALVLAGGHDEKTAAAFTDAGAASNPALRYPPFWNTVGHVDLTPLVQETALWLKTHATGPAPCAASLPPFPSATPAAELATFASDGFDIRAIWDLPVSQPQSGVLFLHGWSGDRTGPHRLFTLFARQLTRQGALCLRPDFTGRGLSDGDASDASIARMARDAQTALDALRARLPPAAPIAVVAICSGCKVAVTLAANNPQQIQRLLLWSAESMGSLRNPATGFRKTANALTTYARKLLRPETWKKILTGKVQTGMVTKALVKHETRSAAEASQEDAVLKRFESFRNPILFIFGGSDPDASGSLAAYTRFCRARQIPHAAQTIPNAGHSFYGADWTRQLCEASARFLTGN